MSSRKSATTPTARRPLARAAKAPRATTGVPRRARINPFGAEAGGSQADVHEAAEVSDNDTSDGVSKQTDGVGGENGRDTQSSTHGTLVSHNRIDVGEVPPLRRFIGVGHGHGDDGICSGSATLAGKTLWQPEARVAAALVSGDAAERLAR